MQKLVPDTFLKKMSISLAQLAKVSDSLFLLYAKLRSIKIY